MFYSDTMQGWECSSVVKHLPNNIQGSGFEFPVPQNKQYIQWRHHNQHFYTERKGTISLEICNSLFISFNALLNLFPWNNLILLES
jgi:hypothetical protein